MLLDLLPTRTAGAAENMAADFLLLQRYVDADRARFRHYDWRRPAFTFGFSQKIATVRTQIAVLAGSGEHEPFDLCRRPTGGGIVDHREDWTYALAIPRGHPLGDARAGDSYRAVHACLAAVLGTFGQSAVLKSCDDPATCADKPVPPGVCFTRAEPNDVVHVDSGVKIAGAAQKRSKRGLLFQGSIWKPALDPIDWPAFHDAFTAALAGLLEARATPVGSSGCDEDELMALTDQYASTEWIEVR